MDFFNKVLSSVLASFSFVFGPSTKNVDNIAYVDSSSNVSDEIFVSKDEHGFDSDEQKENIDVNVCTCMSCPMHNGRLVVEDKKNSVLSFDTEKLKDFVSNMKAKIQQMCPSKQKKKILDEHS